MFKTWEGKGCNSHTFQEHSSSYVFYWFAVDSPPSISVVFLHVLFSLFIVFNSTYLLPLG